MGGRIDPGGSEDPDGGGDLSAISPQQPPPRQRPEMGFLQKLATPMPWEGRVVDTLFGSADDGVGAMAPPPQRIVLPPVAGYVPMERSPRQNPMRPSNIDLTPSEQTERHARMTGSQPKAGLPPPTPQTSAPKGPAIEGNAAGTARPGTNSKTALPLYFAKAMGYAIPGAPGDAEEARFAKAAHQALLKMTKGMSVARFLASHQSPKTRDTFGRYLDAELRKGQQPASQSGKTSTANEPVSMMARPPPQPGG